MHRTTLFQAPASGNEIWVKAFNMDEETRKKYLTHLSQNIGNLPLLKDAEKIGDEIFKTHHDNHVSASKDGKTQLKSDFINKVDHVGVQIHNARYHAENPLESNMNQNQQKM